VLASERMLYKITCYGYEPEGMIKYGHPYFGIPAVYQRGRALKEYYEQRLGIRNIIVDYKVFEK